MTVHRTQTIGSADYLTTVPSLTVGIAPKSRIFSKQYIDYGSRHNHITQQVAPRLVTLLRCNLNNGGVWYFREPALRGSRMQIRGEWRVNRGVWAFGYYGSVDIAFFHVCYAVTCFIVPDWKRSFVSLKLVVLCLCVYLYVVTKIHVSSLVNGYL